MFWIDGQELLIEIQNHFFDFKTEFLIKANGWIRGWYVQCEIFAHARLR